MIPKISDAQRTELMTLYLEQGLGAIRLPCRRLGVSANSIMSRCIRKGFKRRAHGTDHRWEKAKARGHV